jgi:hypothetical protein
VAARAPIERAALPLPLHAADASLPPDEVEAHLAASLCPPHCYTAAAVGRTFFDPLALSPGRGPGGFFVSGVRLPGKGLRMFSEAGL